MARGAGPRAKGWDPKPGERVSFHAWRWLARHNAGEWGDLGGYDAPPVSGDGWIRRKLPKSEVADYEIEVTNSTTHKTGRYCYCRDEIARPR
jgi:hypothetical protein